MIGRLPPHVEQPNPEVYLSNNYVVLDFETTTKDYGSPLNAGNRLVLTSWRRPDGEMVTRRGSEFELGDLLADVEAADFVVAHNTKFELGWLRRCGLDLHNVVVYDTMFADYVLQGNELLMNRLSLSACLKRHGLPSKFDLIGSLIKGGVPTEDIPAAWLARYCERDVEACHELFELTRVRLADSGKLPIMYQRCLVTPCLTDMEFNGMQLDVEAAEDLAADREAKYFDATRNLEKFSDGVNQNSPLQMRAFLYEDLGFKPPTNHFGKPFVTATGEFSVASDILAKLRPTTSRQRAFLSLRKSYAKLNAEVTKYLRKFKDCCIEAEGRLYGIFNQTSTKTHRLSSSGRTYKIQFQNLDRNFKPMFTSRHKDWLIGEADGAQLEFRIAAHLGRDKVALSDIRDDVDVHSNTAAVLTGAGQETDRQGAKEHTFKPLYGGSSGTEAERTYYESFKARYSGVSAAQQSWIQSVLRDKYLRTEWGMEYFWPDTRTTKSGYVVNTTSICNYPVQAFATAEVIPLALVSAWHRINSAGLRMFLVNTVHDSIIAEMPPEEVKQWHQLAQQCLIDDVYYLLDRLYGIKLTVPLGAGVTIGTHWGDKASKDSEVVYTAAESLYLDAATKENMI